VSLGCGRTGARILPWAPGTAGECPIVAGPETAGFHDQPAGPFAALITFEDAFGSQLGLIYRGTLGVPAFGAWTLTDRFWQESDWASDVTSICWSRDDRLFVATSGVYGHGGLFALDLVARKARRLAPVDARCGRSTCVVTILGREPDDTLRVKLAVHDHGGVTETIVSVDARDAPADR
jgi:hypothetical protein